MADRQYAPTSTSDARRRLIGCQGSIQLVIALAALRQRQAQWKQPRAAANWLLIHDLYAPPGQDAEFVDCLRRMASALEQWEQIVYLNAEQGKELAQIARRHGGRAAAVQWQRWFDVPVFDELYLSQNRVLINDLLGECYSEAQKVCYGDGFGVNFSADYFATSAETRSWLRRWRLSCKHMLRRLRGKTHNGTPGAVPFDHHCLLLPNLFDQQLSDYELLDVRWVETIFHELQSAFRQELNQILAPRQAMLAAASQIVVLLTSNLSEAGRMLEHDELNSYLDVVHAVVHAARPSKSSLILVKPHPRDSADKIAKLCSALNQFCQVVVLNDSLSFFIPFEVLLDAIRLANPQLMPRMQAICVSSACLSLELLHGMRCTVAFGEEIVRQRFFDPWREKRLQHERDLIGALAVIRHRRQSARPYIHRSA